jgi:hypothetical protein
VSALYSIDRRWLELTVDGYTTGTVVAADILLGAIKIGNQ